MRKRSEGKLHEGKIQLHGRFGFLLSETPGKEDIMVRGPSLRLAMEGDRVLARMTTGIENRPMGEIVKVLERARKTVVGTLVSKDGRWLVAPEDADERDAVRVLSFAKGIPHHPGQIVVVQILQWPTLKDSAAGEVCESLGMRGEPGVRLRYVLRSRDLPDAFPEPVLAESRSFPDKVSPEMWEGRLDLRALPVFTIDGADAKDFDDAVSLEILSPELLRLGVHIADVSNYVKPGSALDAEAAERATSVYMADRVVPMLPPNLSDHLCSLLPSVERLTLSCFMDLDAGGNVKECSFKESVIASKRRFTYEEVEALLTGQDVPNLDPDVKTSVLRMGSLFKTLHAQRLKRGALDLSTPEYKVLVDAEGRALSVAKRERLDSHRLIEEFMLLANETTATTLLAHKIPFLSRIHPDPDTRKLSVLAAELAKLGVSSPGLIASPASAMQAILKNAEGHPLEDTIHMLVTRGLKQASYSHEPGGHFGLASSAYCHFTSPIRRYPDLTTHRAVRAMLRGQPGTELAEGLQKLGAHCSERERLAADAERQSVDILRAQLLKKQAGQVFEAVVSGSAGFGIFVTLKDSGASGLVRKAAANLGSRVQVQLDRVNEDKGELDFSLAGGAGQSRFEKPGQSPGRSGWQKPRWSSDKSRHSEGNKPRRDKPGFDPNRPKWGKPRFDPSKPRWDKPKWDPSKPKPAWGSSNKPKRFDPSKPKYDPNKPKWDKPRFDPSKPRWDKPKWDPNKPKRFDPSKPKYDPNKPKWDKPKFDPNKPRPKWESNRPKFDPTKPKPAWGSKPKWDPSKPKPKWGSDKPKFNPNKPRFESKFRRPKPGGKPFNRG